MKDKDDGEASDKKPHKYTIKIINKGYDVAKKNLEKKTKKWRKLGSPSISRNLKVNEMLYKSLNEQQKKEYSRRS
nr:hypothetical protein [Tanacetum cinerariifolium]